ncbi:MAG: ribosome-associated translation inhibitor RaiA [Chloroflexi bacterium]|nr:ribosome-associated translation inhibitor RaiA [Chloroflexota bacterium]
MEITIHGRGIELPAQAWDYLTKKLRRLDRHLSSQAQAIVEVARSAARSADDRLVVQVTISSNGTLLRGEQSGADVYTAIDAVAGVLDRQIERYKSRLNRRGRTGLSRMLADTAETEVAEAEPVEEPQQIVRTKQFLVEPMLPDDAAAQMELLGHDFYVFLNTATGRLAVIYRRRDGDYGLLDPQIP